MEQSKLNLQFQQYISFAKDIKKVSPTTITNYNNAVKTIGKANFDSEQQYEHWNFLLELLKGGTSYGAVREAFILSQAVLNHNDIEIQKGPAFKELKVRLEQAANIPQSYTADQLKELLKVSQAENFDLFRLIILCIYSGLRVSAPAHINCKMTDDGTGIPHRPLFFKDFQEPPNLQPGTQRVLCYTVFSKGRHYIATISRYAYDLLEMTNITNQNEVVTIDPKWTTPFDIIYRSRFEDMIKKHALFELMKDKKPFHSMRKFFEQKVGETPGILDEEIDLLCGYPKAGIAYKHYIKAHDKGFFTRVATIYQRTPIAELKLI